MPRCSWANFKHGWVFCCFFFKSTSFFCGILQWTIFLFDDVCMVDSWTEMFLVPMMPSSLLSWVFLYHTEYALEWHWSNLIWKIRYEIGLLLERIINSLYNVELMDAQTFLNDFVYLSSFTIWSTSLDYLLKLQKTIWLYFFLPLNFKQWWLKVITFGPKPSLT